MARKGAWFTFDHEFAREFAGEGIRRKVLCYDDSVMTVCVAIEASVLVDVFTPVREDFIRG